jgi:farnesyl diphosphate synthase
MIKIKKGEWKSVEDLSLEIGIYFQIQDDYLDCYGDESTIGKKGTDIQENKFSWLYLQAIKHSNKEQLNVLKEHYGKNNEESVMIIKKLYNDLNLKSLYVDYENQTIMKIHDLKISLVSLNFDSSIFDIFLKKLIKRVK